MSKLDSSAELVKIGQLLGVNASELAFMEQLPLASLIQIRSLTTDKLFNDGRKLFQKLASASKLLPTGLTASMGEKIFGPMLCARIASEMPYQRAVELAMKMSVPFLAQVTLELDPRRVKDIIQNVPVDKMRQIARELLAQKHYIVMGGFVGFMKPENLRIILNDVTTEEALLHIGFFVEGKHQLSDIMRLLPKERLNKLISYVQTHEDLWPEALALMMHLDGDLKRELGDLAAERDESVLDNLVKTVHKLALWQDALPLFLAMSPSTQYQLVNVASLKNHAIIQEVVEYSARFELWANLLPLVEFMSIEQRQLLAQVIVEQGVEQSAKLTVIAQHHHLWQPLLDIFAAMTPDAQKNSAAALQHLLGQDAALRSKLQPLLEQRELSHLLGAVDVSHR